MLRIYFYGLTTLESMCYAECGREGHISPNPNPNIYYILRYMYFITY